MPMCSNVVVLLVDMRICRPYRMCIKNDGYPDQTV